MVKCLLVALAVTSLMAGAQAQTRGGFGGFHNGGGIRIGPGFASGRGSGGSAFLADPFWYADYPAQSVVYEPPASPVIVVQPSGAPAIADPKPEPLMIEWQGDKYVRISGQRQTATLDYSQGAEDTEPSGSQRRPSQSQTDLPPVALVFRDGHREEVTDYVIANGSLYARGNYWHDGFWTKTVQLSSLDISATLSTNSQAGVSFVLPSSSNEVITRP
jgi:hypothetical protein